MFFIIFIGRTFSQNGLNYGNQALYLTMMAKRNNDEFLSIFDTEFYIKNENISKLNLFYDKKNNKLQIKLITYSSNNKISHEKNLYLNHNIVNIINDIKSVIKMELANSTINKNKKLCRSKTIYSNSKKIFIEIESYAKYEIYQKGPLPSTIDILFISNDQNNIFIITMLLIITLISLFLIN